MIGEAHTCHDFVWHHDEGQDFYSNLNVWLEVLVQIIIYLVLIFSNVVSCYMVVIGLLPSINFLLTIEPNLGDGLHSFFKSGPLELFKQQLKMRRQYFSHFRGHLFVLVKANTQIKRQLRFFILE